MHQGGASPAPDRRASRVAWWLFAPPFAAAALHWWLTTLAEKEPTSLQPLAAAAAPGGGPASLLWQASWPFLLAMGVLALLVLAGRWSWRRFGGARVMRVSALLWLLIWVAAAMAIGYRFVDRTSRQTLPEASATVLNARAQEASARGVGGAQALLRVQGFELPQRVLLEEADAAKLPAGTLVSLMLVRGRFGTIYVTGWRIDLNLPQRKSPVSS